MNSNKLELLVPAGSMEAFKAAIFNGADAIFIGGKNFGARAFANNFDHDELIECVKLAHLHDVRVHVTVNTMLYESEFIPALKEVEFLYKIGVDALIVQDIGLMSEIKKRYSNMEIHASTQAHIHNLANAKFISDKLVKRVVLARETPLSLVKEIVDKGIEVEIFAHGALCISYSGQCLMSSVLFNRSGNKGTCAQCCRLQYKLHDLNTNRYFKAGNDYLLSPKDLNTLEYIPDIIKSGVSSIKIEGRMKRPEYVGLVTRLYRQAIDAFYDNKEFIVTDKMIQDLKLMFNRGFTKGNLFKVTPKELYNQYRPNHLGIKLGRVVDYKNKQIYIKLEEKLNQGDGLRIIYQNNEYGIVANKIYKDGLLVNSALKDDIVAFDFKDYIDKDAIVLKTTDIKLLKEINDYEIYRKTKINFKYKAKINEKFSLIISDGNHEVEVHSDFILQKANKAPITKEKINELLSRINDTPFMINEIDGELDYIFAPIKIINDVKRQAIQKLIKLKEDVIVHEVFIKEYEKLPNPINDRYNYIIEINNDEQYQIIKDLNSKLIITKNFDLASKYHLYYINSNINENSKYNDYDLNVASELGNINNSQIAYHTLNIANSYSVEFIFNQGIKAIILSSELNDLQINEILNKYHERYLFYPNIYRHLYGKRDLMYLKKSFIDNDLSKDINEEHKFNLVGINRREFPLYQDDNNILHILEDKTHLNTKLDNIGSYLCFIDENKDEILNIIHNL